MVTSYTQRQYLIDGSSGMFTQGGMRRDVSLQGYRSFHFVYLAFDMVCSVVYIIKVFLLLPVLMEETCTIRNMVCCSLLECNLVVLVSGEWETVLVGPPLQLVLDTKQGRRLTRYSRNGLHDHS